MTRLIELPQEVEALAAAQARDNGKSIEEYLPELLESALVQNVLVRQATSANYGSGDRTARIRRFRQWAESNGHGTPHLSDVEISREALYPQI